MTPLEALSFEIAHRREELRRADGEWLCARALWLCLAAGLVLALVLWGLR